MTVDEDPDFDDRVFERRYWPSRVYRDGAGPHVKLMLTDAMPRRLPLMDAAVARHQATLDAYAGSIEPSRHRPHQISISDASVRAARSKSEQARAAMIMRARDAWKGPSAAMWGDPGDDDDGDDDRDDNSPPDPEAARREWIARQSTDRQRGAYSGPNPSDVYGRSD
jgi:hypothetical protein